MIPLIGQKSETRAYIGCLLALLSTIYFREMSPFKVEFTNFIAVLAQYVILLAFLAALIIETGSLSSFGLSNFGLGCVLGSSNLVIIFLSMRLAYIQYRQDRLHRLEEEAKVLKIEYAAAFSRTKFETTLSVVKAKYLPNSDELCYYYTTLQQARECIQAHSIPATTTEKGIVVSLDGPMDIDDSHPSLQYMNKLAPSFEAVLCLSLPRSQ